MDGGGSRSRQPNRSHRYRCHPLAFNSTQKQQQKRPERSSIGCAASSNRFEERKNNNRHLTLDERRRPNIKATNSPALSLGSVSNWASRDERASKGFFYSQQQQQQQIYCARQNSPVQLTPNNSHSLGRPPNSRWLDDSGIANGVEWYIQLAAHCFENDFQWHVNHLDECLRQAKAFESKPSVLPAATSAPAVPSIADDCAIPENSISDTFAAATTDADCRRLLKRYLDRDADNETICNIRIDINGIINNRLGNYQEPQPRDCDASELLLDTCPIDDRINWCGDQQSASEQPPTNVSAIHHMHGNMNVAVDAITNQHPEHQTIDDSGDRRGNINQQPLHSYDEHNQQEQQQQHIDNIIRTLCTIKLTSSENNTLNTLPQILLTDCSSKTIAIDSATAIASTTRPTAQRLLLNHISANNNNRQATATALPIAAAAASVAHSSIYNGCLAIPHETYYRSESRPP